MRLAPLLLLTLSVAACDKSSSKGDPTPGQAVAALPGAKAEAAKTDPTPKPDPAKAGPAAKEPAPAPPPAAAEPPAPTGILDMELQKVGDSYKVLTPRISVTFSAKPTVERQDAQTPFGDTIPGGVAEVEAGDRFGGMIYIPIPKAIPYDVEKGLKGARDGMLGMFEGPYKSSDEKAKLGPFDANHVKADGSKSGHTFHIEAWIAYDEVGKTVYSVMELRQPGDLANIDAVAKTFALRDPNAPLKAAPEKAAPEKAAPAKAAPAKAAPKKGADPYE